MALALKVLLTALPPDVRRGCAAPAADVKVARAMPLVWPLAHKYLAKPVAKQAKLEL